MVALKEVDGGLGAPWSRPVSGTFDQLVVESEVLAENPLGDPIRRPLYLYGSPGAGPGSPVVFLLQGYSGQADMWLARKAFEPNVLERLDAMFAVGDCPPARVVFLDAWTSIGGSQFLNSAATGRYMDYVCDEVVPFVQERYRTGACGVAGHSSGGYGAMALAMLRPDTFQAFASHAGDALFECCYLRDFPVAARALRDRFDGSYEVLLQRVARREPFDWTALSVYAMAAAYSPDLQRPGEVVLPFEISTGGLVDDVWQRWLEHDPVRMAASHGDALAGMRRIYLDAGRSDEYYLDLAAQAFAAELTALGIDHSLELFEGRHGGIAHRYPGAVRELVTALAGVA